MMMNHELVHVASNDISSEEDRRWRRFFLGKVAAQRQNPESLVYSFLTLPRFTAPRWYLEGGAVFMETWMSGGLGRAQGGYDEMVFRAMVRDDAHFYDPLGLASRGVQVDFQIGANAYLYGTRFFTYLAYTYSPEKVVAWYPTRRRQRTLLGGPVSAGVRHSDRAGVAGLDRFRTRVPARESRRGAKVSDHAAPQSVGERGRLGIAHLLRRGDRHALRRLPLPGHGRVRRRAEHARRQRPATRRHQAGDALPGHVVCLRPGHAGPPFSPTTTRVSFRFGT